MTDFCIAYKEETTAREFLVGLTQTLENTGRYRYAGRDEDRAALSSARVMLLIVNSEDEFADRELTAAWEFFSGEIRWKRKNGGKIVLLVPEDVGVDRMPFLLKGCAYFNFSETAALAEYLDGLVADDGKSAEAEAVPLVKQIAYSPRPPAVKQIEFSVRAPTVPSFDGTVHITGENREESGCKDDHVFGEEAARNAHERPRASSEADRPRPSDQNGPTDGMYAANKAPVKKKSGWVVAFVFLFVLAVIAVFVIGAVAASRMAASQAETDFSVSTAAECVSVAEFTPVSTQWNRFFLKGRA